MRKVIEEAHPEEAPAGGWISGPQLADHFGVSSMTIWRWRQDPSLSFPRPITVRHRNFWSMSALRAWERRMALVSAGVTCPPPCDSDSDRNSTADTEAS